MAGNEDVLAVKPNGKPTTRAKARLKTLGGGNPNPLSPAEQAQIDALAQVGAASATMTLAEMYEAADKAQQALLYQARNNINVMAEMVLRDEKTGGRVRQADNHIAWHRLVEQHPRLVIWSHVESAKTQQLSIARALYELGRNPMARIGIVSNTYKMAEKIVRTIGKYIEQSAELKAIFGLEPDKNSPWTSTALFVKRKTYSKDPSIQACGVHGNILGSRLTHLILDDVLDYENVRTPVGRQDLWDWYHSTLPGRLEEGAKVTVIGTAWNPDDIMHRLAKAPGWHAKAFPVIDAGGQPMWPERWSLDRIAAKRVELGTLEFSRQMLCQAHDDSTAKFKREWIEKGKILGEGKTLVHQLEQMPFGCRVFTGVDLAVQQHASSDLTVLFTFIVAPNGMRQILNIESGRWAGPEIITKIRDTHRRYQSMVIVENNAAQDYIVQMLKAGAPIPVRGYMTGRQKGHPEFGVESLAIELEAGKWVIPNTKGKCHPEVEAFINELLFYDPRSHTGDRLMACWLGREGVRMGEVTAERGRVDLMSR